MDPNVYIINELTQGLELAMHLKSILSSESVSETKQILIEEIISSYNRAMFMVNFGDSGGQTTPPAPAMHSQPESSVSIDENKVLSKKRKAMPTWQDHIRISTANDLEGNTDDGYSWRKYGQKTILGAKFPRSYYRCTYKHAHNCMARKQVQRTDEDPAVFDIIYRGKHTCNRSAKPLAQRPEPPEKHEMLSNLKENLRVSTSDLDATASFETIEDNREFTFWQGSPSGSNYFTDWGNEFRYQDDSNLSGVISTTTSATNSPLAFPNDLQDFSPFNNLGFLI